MKVSELTDIKPVLCTDGKYHDDYTVGIPIWGQVYSPRRLRGCYSFKTMGELKEFLGEFRGRGVSGKRDRFLDILQREGKCEHDVRGFALWIVKVRVL